MRAVLSTALVSHQAAVGEGARRPGAGRRRRRRSRPSPGNGRSCAEIVQDRAEAAGVVGREVAGLDQLEGALRGAGWPRSPCAARRPSWRRFSTSSAVRPKMKMLSGPTCSQHLDVGAVERADGERAVEPELHVAGARGLHAGGADLLGEVGAGDQDLGQADVVVRQEQDLQPLADRGSAFTTRGHVVDELDDQLGAQIGGGGLAGEDLDPRRAGLRPCRRACRRRVADRLQDVRAAGACTRGCA